MWCIVRINSVFSWGGKYSYIYNLSFGLPKGYFLTFVSLQRYYSSILHEVNGRLLLIGV